MTNRKKSGNSDKKGGKIVTAVCVVIIIVLLAVILYLLFGRQEKPRRNVVVNEDNVEEVLRDLPEPVEATSYEATMNSTWNFASGDAPSYDAYVKNAEANTNAVYFDVVRTDTEETIYESPILPVGSYLEDITLDTDLPAGTYDCVLTYHLLDEDEESVSTVRLTLTVVIEQ